MAEAAAKYISNEIPIPIKERVLTEVDNLLLHRLDNGSYPDHVLHDVLTNLAPAVQEAAMPYAVTTKEHTYVAMPESANRRGTFMWLGKTAVQNAASGFRFHISPAARSRVEVEVDEADYSETELRPDVMKIFISPRMTSKDAPSDIAKQEHLSEEDAVRASWLKTDKHGCIEKLNLASLLVRHIPLQAWIALLEDPNSPFGKPIPVEDTESALSVMKIHRELEVPFGRLPEGPVSIVEAVIPYIGDKEAKQKVIDQLALFRGDQELLREKAELIAERWLKFEVDLAESLYEKQASLEIKSFIIGLQAYWGEEDLSVIHAHQLPDAEFRMSRELAIVLEKAKQNILWTEAAVATDNQEVLMQVDPKVAEQIRQNSVLIQMAIQNGFNPSGLEAQNSRLTASQNVKVGAGCPGKNEANFRDKEDPSSSDEKSSSEKKDWKWKQGLCQVKSCPTRPKPTEVGPCNVCRRCQAKFDKGEDPTKETLSPRLRPIKITSQQKELKPA